MERRITPSSTRRDAARTAARLCLIALLSALAHSNLLNAAEPPSAPLGSAPRSGPRIQFAQPLFDFGKVVGGERIEHQFYFTNTGDALLEVTNVRTTCGCAVVGKWTRQVEPGKSGSIPLELLTVNLSGPIAKSVEVLCNATPPPSASLQFTGSVWWPIEITPTAATLSLYAHTKSNVLTSVRIVNNQTNPVTLSAPVSSNPRILPTLHTVRTGMEYRLDISVEPPSTSGNVFGQINLKTSTPKMPELKIPVYALVQEEILALPSPLPLPPKLTGRDTRQTISIRSFWAQRLVLSEPSLSAPGIDLRLDELQPGRFFAFTLTFPEGFALSPGQRIDLKVKTNHPHYPIVTVPIMAGRFPASPPGGSTPAPAPGPVPRAANSPS